MTKKLTNTNSSEVIPKVGAKTAYMGRDSKIDSFRKSNTLSDTKGSHNSVKDPAQLAEKERLRTKLQTTTSAASQKTKKGNTKRRCLC
mmetsp:Transcript_108076/g.290710  ORF Transcript_108076/g.290710 Transcript_108076/m.290710 type:complete len:88 (+) Transcript_108076:385-648(+)